MSGEETYGSTGAGGNCIAGTPFAVSGPLEDASADLGDVPVLRRGKTTAPDDVASQVPNADPSTARTFKTSHGSAWVLVDPSTRRVCVVADDNGTGYGVSCEDASDARDVGAISTFEDANADSAAGDTVFALVPNGVDELQINEVDGSTRSIPAVGGVATTTLTAKDAGVTLSASPTAASGAKATRQMLSSKKVRRHHAR